MIPTSYNCAQPELYLACRIGWKLCSEYLPEFTGYKPKYTAAYIAQNLADIDATDTLDDSKARYVPAQNLRIDLVAKKEEVLDYFQLLKGYITDAYTANKAENMIQAAGQQFYTKAKSCNWVSVQALLSAAIPFINNNLADLTADDNMPAEFATRFKLVKTEFDNRYDTWHAADTLAANQTDEKLTANNALFAKWSSMLADAQKVFRNQETMAKKFVAATIIAQTRGTRAAGFSGKITDETTGKNIVQAKVSIALLGKSELTDTEGRYDFSPLAAGLYNIQIEAEGYQTAFIEGYEVKTGIISRLNRAMVLAPVAVAVIA